MSTVLDIAPVLGVLVTCAARGVARASYYRKRAPVHGPKLPRPSPPRRLPDGERTQVLDVLHELRFVDLAPLEVYATLLQEGRYLCSPRTKRRILGEQAEVRERRDQLRHPSYRKPELLATAPNQLWSWDITKLLGPQKWTCYYLYVLLDVFSQYVVGWMVAHRESATLAEKLIADTCAPQGIEPGQLTLHADFGSSRNPRLWPSCSPTWASPRPTRGRTSATTTRSARRSSTRSTTDRTSPNASARSRTPAVSADRSSTGTTATITAARSAC